MVPFRHSSWKHFLPKIVLSSALGRGTDAAATAAQSVFTTEEEGGLRGSGLPGLAWAGKGGVLASGAEEGGRYSHKWWALS